MDNQNGSDLYFQAVAVCMSTEPGTVIATASKGFKVAKKVGKGK
jgi:hypothetical protein